MRQRGEDVFFLTGTDEHGEPVAVAAEREGVSPQALADRNAERFKGLGPLLGLSNDFFIRTTDEGHTQRVQEVLTRVKDNGHVYKGTYEGWYCPRCADFKTEAETGPGNTCLVHKIELQREHEENYFFRLSAFQEQLERLYENQPDIVLPRHRYNEARSFIRQGLQDVSLSRAKLSWGVPVPWDPEHVFYVWFDALLNYFTALSYARDGDDLTAKFWPATFHVIGKDILKFHTVFWPALLLAAGIELPRHVFVHGFLLTPAIRAGLAGPAEGSGDTELEKMSKSRGNVIDPFAIIEMFGADALRFYCAREVSFGHDGPVSEATFATRYETELANELGNLASRTLSMLGRYRDGQIPQAELDDELAGDFEGLAGSVKALLDTFELTQALEIIWQGVRRLNRYVEAREPWVQAKDDGRAQELDRTLASLAEGLRVLAVLLHAYLPTSTTKLLEALGDSDTSLDRAHYGDGGQGGAVAKLEPLFPKR